MKALSTNALMTLALASLSLTAACGVTEAPADDDTGASVDDNSIQTDGMAPGSDVTPTPRPATCADVLAANASATDGDYTLYIGGDEQKPWQAYCANMSTTPAEYLPLVFVLGDHNFSQYTAGGASPGSNVRTSYMRLRIDPVTLTVDIGDQLFATSTGSLTHSFSDSVTSMPFGVAMSCGNDAGLADIDLRGTPFAVATQFTSVGTGATGGATMIDAEQRHFSLTGSGFCGWTAEVNAPFNPFNAAHASALQLSYAP